MTSNVNLVKNQRYRCAGKRCQKDGTILLKVIFTKKIGYFCESCASELIELELAYNYELYKKNDTY